MITLYVARVQDGTRRGRWFAFDNLDREVSGQTAVAAYDNWTRRFGPWDRMVKIKGWLSTVEYMVEKSGAIERRRQAYIFRREVEAGVQVFVKAFGAWRQGYLVSIGRTMYTIRFHTCNGTKSRTRKFHREDFVLLSDAGSVRDGDRWNKRLDDLQAVAREEA